MVQTLHPPSCILHNHWNDEVAFRINAVGLDCLNKIHRLSTFTIVWVRGGQGSLHTDFSCLQFEAGDMLFFTPFQPFALRSKQPVEGTIYHFSNEFFCLERHRHEVACDGVLFNNIYAPPCLRIDSKDAAQFADLTQKMFDAFASHNAFAREDILYSYLKIFLVHASRICLEQNESKLGVSTEYPLLQQFKAKIEQHFTTRCTPSDYAEMLHISLKALGKLTKKHLGKTPGDLVTERVLIEAKRLLYLSEKSVKEIAFDLGFEDQHYFSRFFKKNASISAEEYRRKVGTAANIFA